MTIREAVDAYLEDTPMDKPAAAWCFFIVASLLRTLVHGEAATAEGAWGGVLNILEAEELGYTIDPDGWTRFAIDHPGILDLDVPRRLIDEWCDADPDE